MDPNLEFPLELRDRLAKWQCDRSVLARFAPSHTRQQRLDAPPADARPAGVLALIFAKQGRWHVPLIVRSPDAKHHKGQVALPGGACEPGEGAQAAALRELEEELGVAVAGVQILGALSPFFVPASRFVVHPFVGWLPKSPQFRANPSEVAELLETPLSPIVHLTSLATEQRELAGQVSEVPYFAVGPHKVWGATCIVLGELATVCEG